MTGFHRLSDTFSVASPFEAHGDPGENLHRTFDLDRRPCGLGGRLRAVPVGAVSRWGAPVSARPQSLLERMREDLAQASREHYMTQGDAARVDIMEKHGAYLELGAPGEAFYGYVYFNQGKWRAGYSIERAQAVVQNFDDLREGFDWIVAAVPK